MTDRELMQQALEALEEGLTVMEYRALVAALRERLARDEQEPFGYFRYDLRLDAWVQNREDTRGTPFYTVPQPAIVTRAEEAFAAAQERGWVGLTDEEIEATTGCDKNLWLPIVGVARAIEAKLKEKNG